VWGAGRAGARAPAAAAGPGQRVIMVPHATAAAAYADRVLVCRDGRIVSDLRDVTADSLTAALR